LKLKTKVFHTDLWGFLFCTSQLQISHETNNRQNFLNRFFEKYPIAKSNDTFVTVQSAVKHLLFRCVRTESDSGVSSPPFAKQNFK